MATWRTRTSCRRLTQTEHRLAGEPVIAFVYTRSCRQRTEAISLFAPELPVRAGTFDPTRPGDSAVPAGGGTDKGAAWNGWPSTLGRSPQALAGCLRDAAPTWSRRVASNHLVVHPEVYFGELTYLLQAGSDRIGALDFQLSASDYVARGEAATLEQLVAVAALVEAGIPIPEDLAVAANHGTASVELVRRPF